MTRLKLRRQTPKSHHAKRAMIAVGAVGAAAEGVRRFLNRRHSEHLEP
jgi:hypothetical protein